jgi:large subunit ribosomal protein L17
MRSLAASLFEHKKISTTEAKAKEIRPYAEKLITRAKHALIREKQGLLPEGQTIDIHNRRMVYKDIRIKAIVQELFDTIAPLVEDRPGGYTRIIKTGQRRGDGSRTAIIELVDWSAPQDGATSFKSKKKAKSKSKVNKGQKVIARKDEIVAAPIDTTDEIIDTVETTPEVVEAVEVVESTPEVVEEMVEATTEETIVSESSEVVEEAIAEPVVEEKPSEEEDKAVKE